MRIYDPLAFIDIERYQKVNIHAASPATLYPPPPDMTVAANSGFLKECVRRIGRIEFIDREGGTAYLVVRQGHVEVLAAEVLARVLGDPDVAAALGEIAPSIVAAAQQSALAARRNTLS
jgi:hypothetical protein